jgi:hypothetical protein
VQITREEWIHSVWSKKVPKIHQVGRTEGAGKVWVEVGVALVSNPLSKLYFD